LNRYELIVTREGSASLQVSGEVVWTSDGDETYAEEFGEEMIDIDDDEQVDAVIDFLVDNGYAPPGVEFEILADGGIDDENL
jgi:hypothetical protein